MELEARLAALRWQHPRYAGVFDEIDEILSLHESADVAPVGHLDLFASMLEPRPGVRYPWVVLDRRDGRIIKGGHGEHPRETYATIEERFSLQPYGATRIGAFVERIRAHDGAVVLLPSTTLMTSARIREADAYASRSEKTTYT